MKPTIRDIAKKAGVSIASVSLVLNDKPSRITAETKQKILDAAQELGYDFESKQKKISIQVPGISKQLIGVVRPRYNDEFVDMCQRGIDRYACIHGYKVITCDVDDSTTQAIDYIDVLAQTGVAGIIMMPPLDMNDGDHNQLLGKALEGTKRPFLLLDQAIDRVFCDFITADNKEGAYMAAEYLLHNGHQDIGMITGKREVYTSRKRVEGFKEALAFYDISIKEENIIYGPHTRCSGYDGMKYFDQNGIRAVFVCGDEMAVGLYEYAREQRLVIGEDISVVGFDDSSAASILIPRLTSVNQPGELMGKKACEVLINRITGADKDAVRTTYFNPVLIERDSVKEIGHLEN
ncbi:MAG: LacI family DNA-binding transcriptional regulator [Lachnospiraceae bacterium]